MKKQKIVVSFFIIVVVIIISNIVHSEKSSKLLAEQSILRVGLDIAVPWKLIDKEGRFYGPEVTIMQVIAKKMNLKIEFERIPFIRGLVYLKSGKIDLMSGILKRPEREEYIAFINPPYKTKSHKVFYHLKTANISIKKYSDLKGLTIGVKRGYRYFPKFDTDKNISRDIANTDEQLIKMLLKKRFPVTIMLETRGDYLIKNMDKDKLIKKSKFGFYKKSNVYLGISKKSRLIKRLPEFEKIVKKMIRSGEIDKIFKSFFIKNKLPIPVYK